MKYQIGDRVIWRGVITHENYEGTVVDSYNSEHGLIYKIQSDRLSGTHNILEQFVIGKMKPNYDAYDRAMKGI